MIKKIICLTLLSFFLISPLSNNVQATFKIDEINENMSMSEKIEILKKEVNRLLNILLNLQSQKKLEKEINAESFLATNLSDESILLNKNSNYFYPIASITKLMNAVIVLENIDLNERITITSQMLEPYGHSPSIFLGLNISAENLLKASLIQSVNDAAESLTYFIGKEKFINLMNEKAKELEMSDSLFVDPHGLSPLNRSTTNDINKLLKYIYLNHPEILEITKNDNFYLPDCSGRFLKFKNLNNFHLNSNFIGGKTGYLPEARQTFASIFNVKDNLISVVLFKSTNRQNDVSKIINWLESRIN